MVQHNKKMIMRTIDSNTGIVWMSVKYDDYMAMSDDIAGLKERIETLEKELVEQKTSCRND